MTRKERLGMYGMSIPAIAVVVSIVAVPLLYSLWISFFSLTVTNIGQQLPFVKFWNYTTILSDAVFWRSIRITIVYTVVTVLIEFMLAFPLAVLLSKDRRGGGILRTIYILPMMVTPAVAGLIWRFIYNPSYGLANYFLGTSVAWLGTPSTALGAVILVSVWRNIPFIMILLLAGIQSLPKEPFEAASVDGATSLQKVMHVLLPMLKPTILIALLMRTVFAFREFDLFYTLTQGGPADTTLTLSLLIHRFTFVFFRMSYGAALSWLLLILTIVASVFYIKPLLSQER